MRFRILILTTIANIPFDLIINNKIDMLKNNQLRNNNQSFLTILYD